MINLLPLEVKDGYLYARRNALMARGLVAALFGVLGVIAMIALGHLYISQSVKTYEATVAQTKKRLEAQQLEATQKRVTDISTSLKLVTDVLSREILFSKLLQQIGSAMPQGASLQNLTIGKLEGGIDLQAVAANYQTATQVQVNLQDPDNKIFEKADILSVTCSTTAPTSYPCQVTIRALFAKDNPFVFVKSESKPSKP